MLQALRTVLRLGRNAERPLYVHFIYLAEACRLVSWLKNSGVAHIHAHFGTNATEVALLACCLGDYHYSFTVHGPEEFDKPTLCHLPEKISHAAFVVAISSFGRSQLYRWTDHADWQKISVVHCGLEPAFHSVASIMTEEPPRRFVCVGRLCEQKGQLILMEAVRILAAKGLIFELVLAGDGEMRAEIEELIQRHDLARFVRITGWISSDQVRDEILASRALVLPSFAEGLPVVIMEAMALRRPVLSTYVAGIPELVRPGENGWLFPAGAVDELARTMEECLATPPERLRAMGEACFERVLARHAIDTEAAKLIRLFDADARAPSSTRQQAA
jgi:colanic acid/amylovoran biosynthesis glycosyltransferase